MFLNECHSFQCNKILVIVKSLILDSFPYKADKEQFINH